MPLSLIKVTKNIRSKLGGIEELAASIKETGGLLQPLVVAKSSSGLELVAGQRRYAAMKLLGAETVPVRIIKADANQVDVMRLVENLQRDNLAGWETCTAVYSLQTQFSTQKELAAAIGKSDGYVSKCIAVVNLRPELERVQHLALRELFSLVSSEEKGRKASGALPGGRFIHGAIRIKEHAKSGKFSLRINFDPERTPTETKAQIVETR
ncbi:MAG: ParB/RepB/Spo0J family partition protein [Oligoflexia bacterium]|nr:ParB/RepB/Spo0J family partition protein [Oligoflexia bacterium]